MTFSAAKINEIEEFYKISLPQKYKTMMLLIGDKIMDISFKNSSNRDFTGRIFNSSIYDIQDNMRNGIVECEMSELYDPCIFFLTYSIRHEDCDYAAYFIKAERTEDCSVYAWKYDILDTYSVEKFSNDIEQWLFKINPFLYFEFQVKKIFCNR